METQPILEQPYKINIEVFEGPMDLLLYLIRKNDVNVYDIPISFIADEYFKYLNSLKELNIDFASEFLVMAAELAHLKSKMLLPDEQGAEEEEEDPRADLVRRLIEYQRYKEAAENLSKRSQLYKDVFVPLSPERLQDVPKEEVVMVEGNAFHLLEAFNKMLAKLPKEQIRAVTQDRMSVSERIFQLIEVIKCGRTIQIEELFAGLPFTRHIVVITFLSLLEMARLKMIKVYQTGKYESIYITGVMQEADAGNVAKMTTEVFDGKRTA